ncbi:DnaJ domain-containing protein [Abditibacterium utsteinense]|uniref:DnaJ domain-containing protein n=1 Tax=Abditibacterium utsteinense TaxID=1960156 RepID=A0A2S8STZ1_9BACT|nr:J domain-containing protein [Abditibacterium utsteinense]PQV64248.1 DnaJ domain-containing protein [Abditibacterium utsteinense]
MSFDPYSVFDVPQSANFETLRAVYRRLARENHPDIASDKLAATARMAQINRAWAILGDENRRAAFDAELRLQNHEIQRQEVQRQEVLRRETAQREIARAQANRRATTPPQKMTRRAEKSPKNAATSRGAKQKPSTRQKAREASGKMARVHRESKVLSASHDSPRALRLMRKITLASRLFHRDGNAGAAIEVCRAVLLADGRNVPARELLSEIYAAQNRIEVALMMLDQAIQIAPDDRLLRRRREHLELSHSSHQAPLGVPRRSLWQKLRARLLKR